MAMNVKSKRGRPLTVHPGERYGLLTVLVRVEDGPRRQVRYLCQCDCGQQCVVRAGSLRVGGQKSCGCLRRERMRAAARAAARMTDLLTGGGDAGGH
jgi:hypothetical protein